MNWLDHPVNSVQTVREKIRQRRAQMLVHSFIYYDLDDSAVSDHQWQAWADELRELQSQFGEVIGYYDEDFKGWTGDTGCHLPLREPQIMAIAHRLLNGA